MPSMQDVLNTLPKHETTLGAEPIPPERIGEPPENLGSELHPHQESESLTEELSSEHIDAIPDHTIAAPTVAPTAPQAPSATDVRASKDPLTRDIEKILEENLAESFTMMTPEQQNKFKTAGERVTAAIRQIIKSGIVQMKKVLSLISDWLRMIPGVNRFFLEKESKIKAEKILLLGGQF
ncbi:MAG: hypothetical protein AAB384_01365 [Patescibacteria group bacterium]